MKTLYFDAFSGISGDMALGALISLGVPLEYIKEQLDKLGLSGWEIACSSVVKGGITAVHVEVTDTSHDHGDEHHHHGHGSHHDSHVHEHTHNHHEHERSHGHKHSHEHDHSHGHGHDHDHHEHESSHEHNHGHAHSHDRNFANIVGIIDAAGLPRGAAELAKAIFRRIAVAEGKVHGRPPESVHFHEVGAIDSIIDIVGTAVAIDYLAPERIFASAVNDGHGFTWCQHGKIPVPVPATLEIFAAREGAILRQIDIPKELVTPTGAGIITELAEEFGSMPDMWVRAVGYGAGTRDLEIPNVLRVLMGDLAESRIAAETVTVIETNIDDTTPEVMGYVMERLLESGALDVYFTSIQMKKNRPAVKLSVLCKPTDEQAVESVIFQETSTIGVRKRTETRSVIPRETFEIDTPFGKIQAKKTVCQGKVKIAPEYESAKQAAKQAGVSLMEVYGSIKCTAD